MRAGAGGLSNKFECSAGGQNERLESLSFELGKGSAAVKLY